MGGFAELDGYPAAQREAMIAEFELGYPSDAPKAMVGVAAVPMTVLLVASYQLVATQGLAWWWLLPLVFASLAVVGVPLWLAMRAHRRRYMHRLLESRSCACGYSLLGMQATEVWVACPECGEIYRPEPYELTGQGLIATPAMIQVGGR